MTRMMGRKSWFLMVPMDHLRGRASIRPQMIFSDYLEYG